MTTHEQELQVVGGIISADWLWKKIGIDSKFVLDLLKKGWDTFVTTIDELVAKTPSKFDDLAWGWVKGFLSMLLNKPSAPISVSGASPEAANCAEPPKHLHRRSRKEVEEMIIKEGGDPKKFAPAVLLILQLLPLVSMVISFIRRILNKEQES